MMWKMADEYIYVLLYHVIFSALLLPQDSVSLRLMRVSVPEYKVTGEAAQLKCDFDLNNERLYAVTWYKDNEQFYKYVPRSEVKKQSYRIEGFQVDLKSSNEKDVVLHNVDLKASGIYRCEVSAEAPAFLSVHGEGKMEVIYLPAENPRITGGQKNYKVGDTVDLNCTSGSSYPPARLKWYINDQMMRSYYEDVTEELDLLTTVVGLKFTVKSEHIAGGTMVVRCVSTITTGKVEIREHVINPLVDNREASLLVQARSCRRVISESLILLTLLFWMIT